MPIGRSRSSGGRPDSTGPPIEDLSMSDFLWIGLVAGLLGLTIAYVRLCDGA